MILKYSRSLVVSNTTMEVLHFAHQIHLQIIFDSRDDVLNNTFKVIDETLNVGESVLVCSMKCQSRCSTITAAYLMKKYNVSLESDSWLINALYRYRWSLYKTLEFLQARRPELAIRTNFLNQLTSLEKKLAQAAHGGMSNNWNVVLEGADNMDSDELLLRNTLLNTRLGSNENGGHHHKPGTAKSRKSPNFRFLILNCVDLSRLSRP